eukprot:12759113-Alexandrium_andersonii.AAC.1
MQTSYSCPLDKHPQARHRIHFANNVTIDETPGTPEAERVRPGRPEDRNTRYSLWRYRAPEQAAVDAVRSFWHE